MAECCSRKAKVVCSIRTSGNGRLRYAYAFPFYRMAYVYVYNVCKEGNVTNTPCADGCYIQTSQNQAPSKHRMSNVSCSSILHLVYHSMLFGCKASQGIAYYTIQKTRLVMLLLSCPMQTCGGRYNSQSWQ